MKIVSNINGNTKTTSYGNKLFYRSSPNGNYTQVKRAFYRSSPNANYTQVYLYDNVAPTITFTSSSADTVTSAYTLTATVSDAHSGITSISVNNVNYPITSGVATVNVSKAFTLGEGINYFTIQAVDIAGNIGTATLSKNYSNQKDNPSYNWGNLTEYTVPSDSRPNHYLYVNLNGTLYNYRTQYNWRDPNGCKSSSFNTAWGEIHSVIPLPKGLSYVTFYGNAGGNAGTGYKSNGGLYLEIYDGTTGITLARQGFDGRDGGGSTSVSVGISQDISASHELYVKIDGSCNGTEYCAASAWTGVTSWEFLYYS